MSPQRRTGSLPDISVVIPAYNAGRFVGEAIESALAQDLPPAEILVVDDGSDDDTVAVVDSYRGRVACIRHDTNRGVAAARNTGVRHAAHEAIAMHDADDRMLPNRLRAQATRLVAGPEVGCVLGRQKPFTHDGGPLPPWVLDHDGQPRAYGPSLLLAWSRTYDVVGFYDESFRFAENLDWLVRVRDAGLEVAMIDEVIIERRLHDANASHAAYEAGTDRAAWTALLRKSLHERRTRGVAGG